ncbi:MAG: PAS domain-containing sensor histidine kinase, partial [Pseudolabrys sp.]|nr:PAS domain-containing sensor histidine kinase [Pseudolabrys sp.]
MTGFLNASLSDARLAAHALTPTPAWLWSGDGTRILWANPVGAAIFRVETADALQALRFEPDQASAAQIIRLAETLPAGDMPRLERLRGLGAYIGKPLTCACSRFQSQNFSDAILVVATEAAGPNLTLDER